MLAFNQIGTGIRSESGTLGFPAVHEYLRKRGISLEDINDLGLVITPAAELIKLARGGGALDDRLAVVFPHFDFHGDYIDWWSARLVDTGLRPAIASFANLAPTKRGKMFCPPGEPPHAYLVPTLDWSQLGDGDPVFLHESCIKAINGGRLGRWSIGLNGVWGWLSKKHDIALVQELKDLPWKAKKLVPVIVFDSNAEDNWDVQTAIARLAARIYEITGQRARHLLLPRDEKGKHQGFDDFCMAVGDEAATAFLDSWEGVEEIGIEGVEMLKLQLNSEVCVVRSLGRIAEQETGTLMTRSVFTDINYAHYTGTVEEGEKTKVVNVPRLWLSDPRRMEVEALDYAPGEERIVDGSLNLWRGMAVDPDEGDVSMWLKVLEHNVKDEGLRKWIVQWMAYPLQNLGAKLNTFIHFYGPPGTGKQAVLAPLMRMYGGNAIVIGRENITSDFNSVYSNKQFINIDELHGAGGELGVAINNKVKKLVTDPVLVVNMKGQPEYRVRNCANLVTTSNYPDSIKLDDDDRRCCVVRFGDRGTQKGKDFWVPYFKWVEGDGAAAVYGYLLGVDMTGFDPAGWAPMTDDKAEVTRATRRVDEQWVAQLWDDPDQVLVLPHMEKRALFTSDELAMVCYAEDTTGVTPGKKNLLGIRMHGAGFEKIEMKVGGRKVRFWIVRSRESTWTPEKARLHLKSHGFPGVS